MRSKFLERGNQRFPVQEMQKHFLELKIARAIFNKMPHQCVRCGKVYDDGSSNILKGCGCGAKLFFYVKKEHLQKAQQRVEKLSTKQKEEMINDVYDLIGNEIDRDKPIVLDIESVNILKPGSYEIDLVTLFKKAPVVYKLEEGKYIIDVVESFKNLAQKKEE